MYLCALTLLLALQAGVTTTKTSHSPPHSTLQSPLSKQASITPENDHQGEKFRSKTTAAPERISSGGYAAGRAAFSKSGQPNRQLDKEYASEYMLQLYHLYDRSGFSAFSNTVRTFTDVQQPHDVGERRLECGPAEVYSLAFNLTSLSQTETLTYAELRLHVNMTSSSREARDYAAAGLVYWRLTLHETSDVLDKGGTSATRRRHRRRIGLQYVYQLRQGWVTFHLTKAVIRWRRHRPLPVLRVTVHPSKACRRRKHCHLAITTGTDQLQYEPILVIFSNVTENTNLLFRKSSLPTEGATISTLTNAKVATQRSKSRLENSNLNTADLSNQTWRHGDGEISEQGEKGRDVDNSRMTRRSIGKKDRSWRRSGCQRRPLYVNFTDLNWDGWIIAPRGYQAYECRGRCYYPLSDHLTPSKHAIIQTLLHTNHPDQARRAACCVPTRLDPISILYVDEYGVFTYHLQYDGMVVAECGCR